MAIILAIDETSGSQNTSQGGVTANDTGNLTVPSLFDLALAAATENQSGATRIGVALSGYTGSGSGSTVVSFGTPVQDVFFASDALGAPVNGVDSGLKTLDGTTIYLYTSSLNNNVVLGRAGSASGNLVFALYLDSVDAGGTSVNAAGGGDVGATATKVWLAQYETIQHIDALGTATDESVIQFLTNKLFVGGNSETSFDLEDAPSGQNLFLTVADGSPAEGEAAIVITGLTAADTVNTSQAGSNPIVVGTNNQMTVPGKGLYVSYVTLGGDPDGNGPLLADSEYAIPNLSSGEAGDAENIRFNAYLPATGGGFTVVQTQPNNGPVQLLLTALNNTDATEKGTSYFAGLGDADDAAANITSITITRDGVAYTASTSGDGILTLTDDDGLTLANVTKVKGKNVSTNVTVDFTGTTALINGLLAGDHVDYIGASHNRVKITNAAAADGTAFDIGEFSVRAGSVTAQLLEDVAFVDDEPTLSFGNLVGTGTDLAQVGFWGMSDGADGANTDELQVALTGFQLGGVAQGAGSFSLTEGAFANGAYQYSGSLTGDFDANAATPNQTITFTLSANPTTGKYALDLSAPVGSTTTTDTATGGLGAGGPDPVQTLFIPNQTPKGNQPPPPLEETVVFFSAKIGTAANSYLAGDIGTGIIVGVSDPTEANLQGNNPPSTLASFIDPRSMNVSTSGIGVDNNNLNGAGATGASAVIDGTDESFVVNPGTLVDQMKVFIDNSVAAYDFAGGERLQYRIFFADGTVSGYTTVAPAMLTAGQKQNDPVSFLVDGAGAKIDAVQLTMAFGEIKIPNIQFITITESLANDIGLDFTATLTDRDGDTATSNFSADLFTNEAANATFDYELLGSASVVEAFDVDLASTRNEYKVTGFDVATDKLVLIGAGAGVGTPATSYNGSNSIVTVLEAPGGQTTSITVVGVDLTQASDYVVFA